MKRKGDFSRAGIRVRGVRCPVIFKPALTPRAQAPASESACLLSGTLGTSCVLPNQGPKFQNLYMGEFRVTNVIPGLIWTLQQSSTGRRGEGEREGDLN